MLLVNNNITITIINNIIIITYTLLITIPLLFIMFITQLIKK